MLPLHAAVASVQRFTQIAFHSPHFISQKVDVNCGIWRRAKKYGTTVREQIKQAVANVLTFIAEVAQRFDASKIVVVGAELPAHLSRGELMR